MSTGLPRPEQPVARVPQPRQDVAVLVQLAVERRGEDRHVGVVLEHAARALRRRHQAEKPAELRAGVLPQPEVMDLRAYESDIDPTLDFPVIRMIDRARARIYVTDHEGET